MIDGQNGEVHAERLVGHVAAARDFLGEVFRRRLRQRGDQAERAGIGDGRDQLGASDPLHAALHDRVFDADQFGEPRLDHDLPSVSPARGRRALFFRDFGGQDAVTPGKSLPGTQRRRGIAIMQKRGFVSVAADNSCMQFGRVFARSKRLKPTAKRQRRQAAETDRVAVASSSNAVEMSRMLMTPIRL